MTFAKASGTLLMIAVPQSGPIMSSSLETAFSLRRFSSSIVTLSLKSMTLMSWSRHSSATPAAYLPGTEMIARLSWSSILMAEERVGG